MKLLPFLFLLSFACYGQSDYYFLPYKVVTIYGDTLTIYVDTIPISSSFGINWSGSPSLQDTIQDTVNSPAYLICLERGHVPTDYRASLLYCPPYILDYPDSSVMIIPTCNTVSYTCLRCEITITEPDERVLRQIIWRRK